MDKLKSMVEYILEIDALTTPEFCREYNISEPRMLHTVSASADQFLNIDAIKHKMFVEHAKKLCREKINYEKERNGEHVCLTEETEWCHRNLSKAGQLSIAHNKDFVTRNIGYAIQNQTKACLSSHDKVDLKLNHASEMIKEYQRVLNLMLNTVHKSPEWPELEVEYKRLQAAKDKHLTILES